MSTVTFKIHIELHFDCLPPRMGKGSALDTGNPTPKDFHLET